MKSPYARERSHDSDSIGATFTNILTMYASSTYRRSISSNIFVARVVPCEALRYSSTQVTRWSLNVPLINWCSISGEISSWISARGKSLVKGWKKRKSEKINLNTTSARDCHRLEWWVQWVRVCVGAAEPVVNSHPQDKLGRFES